MAKVSVKNMLHRTTETKDKAINAVWGKAPPFPTKCLAIAGCSVDYQNSFLNFVRVHTSAAILKNDIP